MVSKNRLDGISSLNLRHRVEEVDILSLLSHTLNKLYYLWVASRPTDCVTRKSLMRDDASTINNNNIKPEGIVATSNRHDRYVKSSYFNKGLHFVPLTFFHKHVNR